MQAKDDQELQNNACSPLLSSPASKTETSQVPRVESEAAVQSSEFTGPVITAAAPLLVQSDISQWRTTPTDDLRQCRIQRGSSGYHH